MFPCAAANRLGLPGPNTGDLASSSGTTLPAKWKSSGLGFCLSILEEGFNSLFGLDGYPLEFVSGDTEELLRADTKSRFEALSTAVTSGILSPNEARNSEGFDSVEYGSSPRMQAQCGAAPEAAHSIRLSDASGTKQATPAAADAREVVAAEMAQRILNAGR